MLFVVIQPKYGLNICRTIVWQYLKYVYDVTAITMTTTGHYESTLSFPVFANYLQN